MVPTTPASKDGIKNTGWTPPTASPPEISTPSKRPFTPGRFGTIITPSRSIPFTKEIEYDKKQIITKAKFKKERAILTQKVYAEFDEAIFDSMMNKNGVDVTWSNTLNKTAGRTYTRK